ncbi:hypothetical protein D9756_011465 [Leucocoprinus leucothites]|uniref:Uncharacterized protein n=1 Tax=Leucocoprinus leucothites TaxID=201217 RepID=A0A8H5FQJ7_9AGAR|nr:hypothetical protein D9756_011470 [Leucoagaricus leucothites]KAF5345117.1 hypothetical protein D9756_011465 [Leucoagaricus leucothites]
MRVTLLKPHTFTLENHYRLGIIARRLGARVPVNAQTCKHLKTPTRYYHHEEIASKGKVIVKAANEEDAERGVVPKPLLANT